MKKILLSLFLLIYSPHSFANSCCGQSPASFTVLSLNQKLSLNTGFTLTETEGRLISDRYQKWNDRSRSVQSLTLNAASTLAYRHQIFLQTAFMKSTYGDSLNSNHSQDASDTLLGYTYELLPEYSFSYWKPVVFVSAFLNLPTGQSIYDPAKLNEGSDVTGHNQWGTGLGVTLRKVYFPLTLTVQGKSLYLFEKQFETSKVSGFYDSSLALLASYATNFWGIGINGGFTFNHLSKRRISPSDVLSDITQSTTILAGLQRNFGDNTLLFSYGDQTQVGYSKNTLLNKTYTLSFVYNYF